MFNVFKRKEYTMNFKKSYIPTGNFSWKEVTDSYLLSVLLEVQEKYGFEIISYKFKDCFGISHITIKCNREDKQKIFIEYCIKLNNYIREVSY